MDALEGLNRLMKMMCPDLLNKNYPTELFLGKPDPLEVWHHKERVQEVWQENDLTWTVRLPGVETVKGFKSLKSALREQCSPQFPVVIKTSSPDYRDWELFYAPILGELLTADDLFRLQLDVSTEEWYKSTPEEIEQSKGVTR